MYEQFTNRARKAIALANSTAHKFKHRYIGTEHILVGLIKENSGVAIKVLLNLGVNPASVEQDIYNLVHRGSDSDVAGIVNLPKTPLAQRAIELAIEAARSLEHTYIGTEHLLIGLMDEADGVASQILAMRGLDSNKIRQEVIKILKQTNKHQENVSTKTQKTNEELLKAEKLYQSHFRYLLDYLSINGFDLSEQYNFEALERLFRILFVLDAERMTTPRK